MLNHSLLQAKGAALQPLGEAAKVLLSTNDLEYMGFNCFQTPAQKALGKDHPAVQEQNSWAVSLVLLVTTLSSDITSTLAAHTVQPFNPRT